MAEQNLELKEMKWCLGLESIKLKQKELEGKTIYMYAYVCSSKIQLGGKEKYTVLSILLSL